MAPRSIKEAHLQCTDASCQGKANQDAGTEGRSLCLGQASQPLRTMTLVQLVHKNTRKNSPEHGADPEFDLHAVKTIVLLWWVPVSSTRKWQRSVTISPLLLASDHDFIHSCSCCPQGWLT